MSSNLFLFPLFLMGLVVVHPAKSLLSSSVPIVTGGNGFIGRTILQKLLEEENISSSSSSPIYSLVRSHRLQEEVDFWNKYDTDRRVCVRAYDMLDNGHSLKKVLNECSSDDDIHVYHVASVFGPTEDHVQTALDNVKGTEDVVKVCAESGKVGRLVVTSSMAAVRSTNQEPSNGVAYTHEDWNTFSELGKDWGNSYQWSKMESERRAWELSNELGVDMCSICPSFVFGPILGDSSSFSIELIRQWTKGESPVQSRLCVDVRDVAQAHLVAAKSEQAKGQRYIVSAERRIPSQDTAAAMAKAAKSLGQPYEQIYADTDFKGGFMNIGDVEVVCAERLQNDLGITCRKVTDTFEQMVKTILTEQKVDCEIP